MMHFETYEQLQLVCWKISRRTIRLLCWRSRLMQLLNLKYLLKFKMLELCLHKSKGLSSLLSFAAAEGLLRNRTQELPHRSGGNN